MKIKFICYICLMFLLNACSGNTFQSTWHPVSEVAKDIKDLTWFLIIMTTFVFIVTMVLMIFALKKKKEGAKSYTPDDKFILWAGLYIPTVILIGTLIWSLQSSLKISEVNKEKPVINIKVTSHQFWWEVEYPDHNIITANEIYVPINTNVRFELIAKDVIHSFWIPNIHGKIDMLPEHKTYLSINMDKVGSYRGQCAEFCGYQHALMAFPLKALTESDFNQWVNRHQRKEAVVLTEDQTIGKEIYIRESCHTCHAVKGTDFVGKTGPDLTHIATRLSLGAGTIPNNRENLGKWIINSQKIKPLNRMPSYNTLPKEDLQKLLDYLESLK